MIAFDHIANGCGFVFDRLFFHVPPCCVSPMVGTAQGGPMDNPPQYSSGVFLLRRLVEIYSGVDSNAAGWKLSLLGEVRIVSYALNRKSGDGKTSFSTFCNGAN